MSGETGIGGGSLAIGGSVTGTAAIAQQVGVLPKTGSSIAILATISIVCGLLVFASQLYTSYKKRA